MHFQQQQYPQQHQPAYYPNSLNPNQYDQYPNNFPVCAQQNLETYQQVSPSVNNPPSVNNCVNNRFEHLIDSKEEDDSPKLRALLNRKRTNECYNQPSSTKRQRTQENHHSRVKLENGSISPVRSTEDSLDYFEDFAFQKQRPMKTEKCGYEYGTVPMGMTSENLIAASSMPPASTTPLTNHTVNSPIVDGFSTPPQTPKSAIENVNQVSKICDASSGTDSNAWTQNGSDCKYLIVTTCVF